MPEPRRTGQLIGARKPRELIELLDGMTPADVAATNIDVDAIGRAIDPRKLRRNELAALFAAVQRLTDAGAAIDLGRMSAPTFGRIVALATRDQLQAVVTDPVLRAKALDEVFRLMGECARPERIRDLTAVVRWRLTEGTGEGGHDRYETVFADGTCTTNRRMAGKPRVTLTLSPVDFLKLATLNASPPVLFLTGKVKVRGDLAFAANLLGLFDVPPPAAP